MEERRNQQNPQQSSGDLGTSENSSDLQNPINTGGKAEHADNSTAVGMTRNPTDRAGAALGTKRDVTGSDFDGQVSQ